MSGADNFWVRFCDQWPQRLQEVNDITTQFAELKRVSDPLLPILNDDAICRDVYDVIEISEIFWREELDVQHAQFMAEKSENFRTTRNPFMLSCHIQGWLSELAPFHHAVCGREECQVRKRTSYQRDRGPYDESTEQIQHLAWALKEFQTNGVITSRLSESNRDQAKRVLEQLEHHINRVYHSGDASEGIFPDPVVGPLVCEDADSVADSRPSSPPSSPVFTRPSSSASAYSDGWYTYSIADGLWTT